jgi:glycosyltransferase involved in cell wall biosynthesis
MKVLVAHPALQHSHQMAMALHEHGMLQQYWSGVPVRGPEEPAPWWLPSEYRAKVRAVDIPCAMRRHPIVFTGLLKLGARGLAGTNSSDNAHRVFHLFDDWVARQIPRIRPDVVVAYENSASRTFEAARRIGARCVLDAPAVHRAAAARLLTMPSQRYLREIDARKDAEVALADMIITCSRFAAQTYVEAGIDPATLYPILLGASPPAGLSRRRTRTHTRFLFAGGVTLLKGVDLLLDAFAQVRARVPDAELVIVGGAASPALQRKMASTPGVVVLGALPQAALFQEIADADCLVLPSRFDSFGMVVTEALSCGTPVLVSDCVGAKEVVEEFPGSGWIVPVNVDALLDRMLDLATVPALLDDARAQARLAGQTYTWARYRQAAAATIGSLC